MTEGRTGAVSPLSWHSQPAGDPGTELNPNPPSFLQEVGEGPVLWGGGGTQAGGGSRGAPRLRPRCTFPPTPAAPPRPIRAPRADTRKASLAHALTLPPPGWCFRFSVEPILDLTFFRSGMGPGAACRRLLAADGDLGGVRTTATFLGSRVGGVGREGVRERLPGVPGEPGLL